VFKRIALVNAHGGNSGLIQAVVREWLSLKPGVLVSVIDYWREAGIPLGHADKVEERVAKHLGILDEGFTVHCESVADAGSIKVVQGPDREVGLEARSVEDDHGEPGDAAVRAVYQALRRLATL
jgi:creatinine amidohydrolase/Fe(II)-dependent formamide hydrolase-like protein